MQEDEGDLEVVHGVTAATEHADGLGTVPLEQGQVGLDPRGQEGAACPADRALGLVRAVEETVLGGLQMNREQVGSREEDNNYLPSGISLHL